MKKITVRILTAIMALMMLASAAACGPIEIPPVTYDTGEGLTIELPAALQELELDGFVKIYANSNITATFALETADDLASVGYENLTLEEYAKLSEEANEAITTPYTPDANGNLVTTYTADVDGVPYFYYVTLRESNGSFWTINLACKDSAKGEYLDKFTEWNNSIVVE